MESLVKKFIVITLPHLLCLLQKDGAYSLLIGSEWFFSFSFSYEKERNIIPVVVCIIAFSVVLLDYWLIYFDIVCNRKSLKVSIMFVTIHSFFYLSFCDKVMIIIFILKYLRMYV